MIRVLCVIALLVVGACAGDAATRATNALGVACDGFAVALEQLTPLKAAGKISADNIARVDAAKSAVDKACLPGSVVDPAAAVSIVNQGIALLNQIRGN